MYFGFFFAVMSDMFMLRRYRQSIEWPGISAAVPVPSLHMKAPASAVSSVASHPDPAPPVRKTPSHSAADR